MVATRWWNPGLGVLALKLSQWKTQMFFVITAEPQCFVFFNFSELFFIKEGWLERIYTTVKFIIILPRTVNCKFCWISNHPKDQRTWATRRKSLFCQPSFVHLSLRCSMLSSGSQKCRSNAAFYLYQWSCFLRLALHSCIGLAQVRLGSKTLHICVEW